MDTINALEFDPIPPDAKPVKNGYRVRSGDYRIYYIVDHEQETIYIRLVDHRSSFYERLERIPE